ncbi:MAG: glutamate--tRNA ligase [Pseudomonadota bacterium]
MSVVTRFAPSPTGFLHIGGARTALFNWLYARHNQGRFLLRIEDTDRERSTEAAIAAIFDSLTWLGIDWDDEPIFQSQRQDRHAEIARAMLDAGHAYLCYASPEELTEMREKARAEGRPPIYDGRWRDRDPAEAPAGVDPVVRLKAPREGETVIRDHVQGDVRIANQQLDDMVLLRANGTPTYMLAVVVDDHDSGITHIVRGDDHLTNAARQTQIYHAMDWPVPDFAHVPLIHGPDGAKLSKRHGALGAESYRDEGFLPDALCNYLLRLGWSHGDDEIISRDQAIAWFGLDGIGRSPARFDIAKLTSLNLHYIKASTPEHLAGLVQPMIEQRLGHALDAAGEERLLVAVPTLQERVKTLVELADNALFFFQSRPIEIEPKAAKALAGADPDLMDRLIIGLADAAAWQAADLEALVRRFAEVNQLGLGKVAQPLRAALTGRSVSPPVFDVLAIFGRDECLARLRDAWP